MSLSFIAIIFEFVSRKILNSNHSSRVTPKRRKVLNFSGDSISSFRIYCSLRYEDNQLSQLYLPLIKSFLINSTKVKDFCPLR
jgi:hypothetical protein